MARKVISAERAQVRSGRERAGLPDPGKGLVGLNRNEYAMLKEIAKAGGKTDSPALTRDPRFAGHPETVDKAKEVYDGTCS
ncbi:MAG TPA: hypothetical protein VN520_39470 [Streptomyces sp.]|uniref:hypothetical protein n=1 Tax=Streptomyces sp. TaxID=1931 RepID=UPI002C25375E|nr:hypothetical protein [Streptomyces sp.]HWU12362.1 hypothetical protein [Streptomyces sp.]